MFCYKLLIIIVMLVGTLGKELSEEKKLEINRDIGNLLTILKTTDPGIKMNQECPLYASAFIILKWIAYLEPDDEYFGGYNYNELRNNIEELLISMRSNNKKAVDNFADVVVCFDDMIEEITKESKWDGDPAILQAAQEMVLQVYIQEKELEVKQGETITVKVDLIVKIKNPAASQEHKLERTFKVPPLDTLTIIQKALDEQEESEEQNNSEYESIEYENSESEN